MEQPIELTAETLWTEVAGRLKGALNDSTYRTWFGEVEGLGGHGRHVRPRRPERLHARVDRGPLPRADPGRRPRRDRPPAPRPADRRRDGRRAGHARSPPAQRIGRDRAEPEVHVRPLRDRLVEPLRARGRARGRRGAGPGVQPALHLRRHRARQDPPAPGDRAVRDGAPGRHVRALRDERDVHERLHQLAPRQAHRGLQAALPQLRRAADRRRAVLRAQGADPGGVLPHVQLALRVGQPDRHLVATGRRARSRRSRRGCARGSSGG